mmetsp:Transcript_534/g.1936  ORF Transcript_534/g.1936 Transcript_534/m.1936 type:complete len:271 (+) Transcript_534:2325-3137(+)
MRDDAARQLVRVEGSDQRANLLQHRLVDAAALVAHQLLKHRQKHASSKLRGEHLAQVHDGIGAGLPDPVLLVLGQSNVRWKQPFPRLAFAAHRANAAHVEGGRLADAQIAVLRQAHQFRDDKLLAEVFAKDGGELVDQLERQDAVLLRLVVVAHLQHDGEDVLPKLCRSDEAGHARERIGRALADLGRVVREQLPHQRQEGVEQVVVSLLSAAVHREGRQALRLVQQRLAHHHLLILGYVPQDGEELLLGGVEAVGERCLRHHPHVNQAL